MLRELNIDEMEDVSGGGVPAGLGAFVGWVAGGAATGAAGSALGFGVGTSAAALFHGEPGNVDGINADGSFDNTVALGALGGAFGGPTPGTLFGSFAVGIVSGFNAYQPEEEGPARTGTVTIVDPVGYGGGGGFGGGGFGGGGFGAASFGGFSYGGGGSFRRGTVTIIDVK